MKAHFSIEQKEKTEDFRLSNIKTNKKPKETAIFKILPKQLEHLLKNIKNIKNFNDTCFPC